MFEVGTTDLMPIALFLDIGGSDYWIYKETHARGVRMAHTLRVCIFFLCMIARRSMELDSNNVPNLYVKPHLNTGLYQTFRDWSTKIAYRIF